MVIFCVLVVFWYFYWVSRGILVILGILEVFWSFWWFLSVLGNFRDIRGHFRGFMGILLILEILGIILDVQGYIGNLGSVRVFVSF